MTVDQDNSDIPFSFPVKVGHVSSNPVSIDLEANEKERKALAESWNIVDLLSLKAKLRLTRWKRNGVRVAGEFEASFIQNCVVSLLPIQTHASEEFVAHFVPDNSKLARQDNIQNGELIIDVDGPDIPDTFSGNTIDVAAVVAEYVAMAIDPYPRDEKAVLGDKFSNSADDTEKSPSPFAALASIKGDLS